MRLRAATPAGAWVGPDGYTPDKHAIICRVGGCNGLYLAAGFRGGGFKVAPAVGQAAAAEILDGVSAPELERFLAARMKARTIEVDASHVSLLSRPRDIAALILLAAGSSR